MKKKGVWIFLTVLFATGGFFLISILRKPATLYENPSSQSFVQFKQSQEKDSDGDGLKDWEELLWKMDPNNPDTDGDGVSDAEEAIRQGKIINGSIARRSGAENEESPTGTTQTETDLLIEKLFNTYLSLKEANPEASTEEIIEALTEPLTAEISSYIGSEPENIYSLSDIKISESNTPDDIKKYGDSVISIVLKNFEGLPEEELPLIALLLSADNGLTPLVSEDGTLTFEYDFSITTEELEIKNEEILNQLGTLANAYLKSAQEILELKVVGDLVEPHLMLINQSIILGDSLSGIKDIFRDPLIATASLNHYFYSIARAYNAVKEMNLYFINNQINLEPKNAEFISLFI